MRKTAKELTGETEGNRTNMNAKHVLIPLDLMRSPCDALVFARNLASDSPVCVTLLYVVNLNVALGRRIYDELCAESELALRKLAWLFFGTDRAVRVVVREGKPHEEIVAEAKAESTDLIILSRPKRHFWNRLFRASTTQRIIDSSPCPAVVLPRGRKSIPHRRDIPAPIDSQRPQAVLPAA